MGSAQKARYQCGVFHWTNHGHHHPHSINHYISPPSSTSCCPILAYVGAQVGLCWGHVGPRLAYVGATWGPRWPTLAASWPMWGQWYGHVGLCWPMLAHIGSILVHLGAILGRVWPMLGPCWTQVGLCWGHDTAMLAHLVAILGLHFGQLSRSNIFSKMTVSPRRERHCRRERHFQVMLALVGLCWGHVGPK